jgi:sugar lactone lactonase YvrE
VYAEFECMPDGSTLDAEVGLWVALPPVQQARRLVDGEVTDVVHFCDEVFDVTLGGPDGTSLYAAVANLAERRRALAQGQEDSRPGRIYRIEVDVPGPR